MQTVLDFLSSSYTAYNACENIRKILLDNGFTKLSEQDEWEISENGKYFIERGGSSIIAFVAKNLDKFYYKIVASHLDSPALKIKENPVEKKGALASLNVETYGGGIWYSFFDRPLKIAGLVVKSENNRITTETIVSPYTLTIPSVSAHQNRAVNDGFAINPQVDLQPLLSFGEANDWLSKITNAENVVSYDLYLVSAEAPYAYGVNNEFVASPRVDNLTSVYASLESLLSSADSDGVCVSAFFNAEEIGNRTNQGADGDFLENTLRRIAYALRFDDNEYYKALASSFLLSVDNAHAVHPNHPEKSDTTNKTTLGGGVVIKNHAGGAYITDAISSAVVKTLFDKAGVKHQSFFNRSDMRSGSTLGASVLARFGVIGADIGLAQLAMHSACESFALADYTELVNGLTAYYSSDFYIDGDEITVR